VTFDYIKLVFLYLLFFFYIILDTFLIKAKRGDKYRENDFIQIYFSYYTDIFFFFLIDLFSTSIRNLINQVNDEDKIKYQKKKEEERQKQEMEEIAK